MSALDEKMSSQVELLLRALAAGIDLAGSGAGGDDSDASDDDDDDGDSGHNEKMGIRERAKGGDATSVEKIETKLDYDRLEEEEARFMGNESDDSEEEIDESELSASVIKKRRKNARKRALAEAKAAVALGQGGGDVAIGDYGDEEVDGERSLSSQGGGAQGNLLQGMVNRISQREQAVGKKKNLVGDLDVPIRERDQTIRVRRPAPGESDSEDGGGHDGGGSSGHDSGEDDVGLGSGGFMGGLSADLLEELSGGGGGGGGGGKRRSKEKRRREADAGGGGGESAEDNDDFYASVAKEKARKKLAKKEKYQPEARIAGALEAELEAERAARGGVEGGIKRGASYSIIKNRGLTPHKNKLNRNPRAKKREAFRKATIRRKGQVRLTSSKCSFVIF